MKYLIADIDLFEGEGLEGYGKLGTNVSGQGISLLTQVLTTIIGLITVVGFIWFVILVITGAIGIISAGGDKNALSTNVKKITNGLIGLIVLISALFIIRLFGTLMGIENILNLQNLFENLPLQK